MARPTLNYALAEQVRQARENGSSVEELAGKFGVSQRQVRRIVSGEVWTTPPETDPAADIEAEAVELDEGEGVADPVAVSLDGDVDKAGPTSSPLVVDWLADDAPGWTRVI